MNKIAHVSADANKVGGERGLGLRYCKIETQIFMI